MSNIGRCTGFRCRIPLPGNPWHGLCAECRAQQVKDARRNREALARGEELRDGYDSDAEDGL
jgi:hypothetical protein